VLEETKPLIRFTYTRWIGIATCFVEMGEM
ncbi:hypothetical protein A2U01_0105982, partial [Trifolium medium]|nr:hypothetical protein [Trifolium medium]